MTSTFFFSFRLVNSRKGCDTRLFFHGPIEQRGAHARNESVPGGMTAARQCLIEARSERNDRAGTPGNTCPIIKQ